MITVTVNVIGLGYVGLPPDVEFGKQIETIGLDIDRRQVDVCLGRQGLARAGLRAWRL